MQKILLPEIAGEDLDSRIQLRTEALTSQYLHKNQTEQKPQRFSKCFPVMQLQAGHLM